MLIARGTERARDSQGGASPERDAVDLAPGRPILCRRCGAAVTSTGARIEVCGLHEHTCENPHGWVYRIGCFAVAEGCVPVSDPSSEWSWFPGWRWQIVHCRGCGEHLGWRFVRHDGSFHGLILDRLVEETESGG